MKTVRRLFYADIVSAVTFVAVAFLSLSFFIDFIDQLSNVGQGEYTIVHATLYSLLLVPGHFYEVAPIAGARSAPAAKPDRGRPDRGGRPALKPATPAAAPPAAGPAAEASEEPGRRRRRSRGRGRDRDREEVKPPAASSDAAASEATPAARPEPRRAAPRADVSLTLAEAFLLLQSALTELPQPASHDKVRARMLALLGREDSLMDPERFIKFLRQANDAEMADVRKVDDGHYDVLPHKAQMALQAREAISARARGGKAPEPAADGTPAAAEPVAESRSVATLRFRRGSRGPLRASDIPHARELLTA